MPTTNNILEKIREVCGLNAEDWKWAKVAGLEKAEEIRSLEIVGHPVQLNHLLWVIAQKGHDFGFATSLRRPNELHIFPQGNSQIKEPVNILNEDIGEMDLRHWVYNLKLTVEQNLNQNPELRKLVGELILN